MVTAPARCPSCGEPLAADAPAGLCPRCLLRGALQDSSSPADELATLPAAAHPARFAHYEVLEKLGRGGMGVVYKARDTRLGRTVALKMILGAGLADEPAVHRFRNEAEAAAALDHPHIVPIYEVGEDDGRHFFTMRFFEGGSLAEKTDAYRGKPQRSAELVASLAAGVHAGHQRGILHRDLKPACSSTPRAARTSRTSGSPSAPKSPASPSRAPSWARPATWRARAGRGQARHRGRRRLQPGRDPLRAPRRPPAPHRRHAAGGAAQRGDPRPHAAQRGRPPRAARSGDRLPEGARARAGAALSLRAGVARRPAPLPRRRAGARAARVDAGTHAPLAPPPSGRGRPGRGGGGAGGDAGAGVAALSPRADGDQRLRRARRRRLDAPATPDLGRADRRRLRAQRPPRAHRRALDRRAAGALRRGRARARRGGPVREHHPERRGGAADRPGAPENRDLVGMDFSARDYVRGALANAGRTGLAAVHVSRVYPSKGDGILKFAITVPVYGPDGPGAPPVGVLGGSVAADATMGLPRLHDARRKVVLVGRWDPNRAPDDRVPFAREPEHLVLLHPAFRHAEPVMEISHPLLLLFTRSEGAELRAASADAPSGADDFYFDPVRRRYPGYAGPWLAGFAPVGNTDLVIIVQTRDWAAVALFAAAAALLAALAALGAVRVFRRIPPT